MNWSEGADGGYSEGSDDQSDTGRVNGKRLPGTKVCIERSRCCCIRIWRVC